jgi:hydrogenase maturation protease
LHSPDRSTDGAAVVIGYGSELRGDDAAGPRAARAVAAWGRPGVRAVAVHQLTPELAEALAAARLAVFIDAAAGTAEGVVCVRRLRPVDAAGALGHTSDPRQLLALARALYGRHPPAWLVTVPAPCLELGAGLSAAAERGLAVALRWVARLVEEGGRDEQTGPFSD